MVEERDQREFTVEIRSAGAGEATEQPLELPRRTGTVESVSYTPADTLPLYDPQAPGPVRNITLYKRGPEGTVLVASGPGGSLTLPALPAGQEQQMELEQHGAALDVAEGEELYWQSGPYAGASEPDPGGVLRITFADESRAIRRYSPGEEIVVLLDLYDDGGIHEVVGEFIEEGRYAPPPTLELRGHGAGAVEGTVEIRTRLRSNTLKGSYRCIRITVRDLGGNRGLVRSVPNIRFRVLPAEAQADSPEVRGWRFPT